MAHVRSWHPVAKVVLHILPQSVTLPHRSTVLTLHNPHLDPSPDFTAEKTEWGEGERSQRELLMGVARLVPVVPGKKNSKAASYSCSHGVQEGEVLSREPAICYIRTHYLQEQHLGYIAGGKKRLKFSQVVSFPLLLHVAIF